MRLKNSTGLKRAFEKAERINIMHSVWNAEIMRTHPNLRRVSAANSAYDNLPATLKDSIDRFAFVLGWLAASISEAPLSTSSSFIPEKNSGLENIVDLLRSLKRKARNSQNGKKNGKF